MHSAPNPDCPRFRKERERMGCPAKTRTSGGKPLSRDRTAPLKPKPGLNGATCPVFSMQYFDSLTFNGRGIRCVSSPFCYSQVLPPQHGTKKLLRSQMPFN